MNLSRKEKTPPTTTYSDSDSDEVNDLFQTSQLKVTRGGGNKPAPATSRVGANNNNKKVRSTNTNNNSTPPTEIVTNQVDTSEQVDTLEQKRIKAAKVTQNN